MKKIKANELTNETKRSMVARIITGIVLILLCIPCLIIGSWHFFGLIFLLTVLCAVELTHITDLKGTLRIAISIITVILTVAIVYYVFVRNQFLHKLDTIKTPEGFEFLLKSPELLSEGFYKIDISVMLVTLMAAVYFIICFITPNFDVKYVFYYVTMILVVAIGAQSFLYLRYTPSYLFSRELATSNYYAESIDLTSPMFKYGQSSFLFLYVLIAVFMNDIGAYFIGILFGKHKMNERISPKKTWEGFLGGIVFSLISSTLFAVLVTLKGKPLLPIFDFNNPSFSYAGFFIVAMSILLPLIADTGDFIFSAIKRYWGAKDFSKILPGHGGILDRLDSLIFSAALVSCFIVFINTFVYGGITAL